MELFCSTLINETILRFLQLPFHKTSTMKNAFLSFFFLFNYTLSQSRVSANKPFLSLSLMLWQSKLGCSIFKLPYKKENIAAKSFFQAVSDSSWKWSILKFFCSTLINETILWFEQLPIYQTSTMKNVFLSLFLFFNYTLSQSHISLLNLFLSLSFLLCQNKLECFPLTTIFHRVWYFHVVPMISSLKIGSLTSPANAKPG